MARSGNVDLRCFLNQVSLNSGAPAQSSKLLIRFPKFFGSVVNVSGVQVRGENRTRGRRDRTQSVGHLLGICLLHHSPSGDGGDSGKLPIRATGNSPPDCGWIRPSYLVWKIQPSRLDSTLGPLGQRHCSYINYCFELSMPVKCIQNEDYLRVWIYVFNLRSLKQLLHKE